MVYRDLKPENILLDKHGQPKLTDLGLALLLAPGETAQSKAGTRGWWAPEVIRRQPYRCEVDWWSLGVLMHSLLSLHSPFSYEAALRGGYLPNAGTADLPRATHLRLGAP